MVPSREAISRWIEWRWSDHQCNVVSVKEGTYGLVWIGQNAGHSIPSRFALKGFNPDKASKAPGGDTRVLFERELDKWLRLGFHGNVLPALGLEFVPPGGDARIATQAEYAYPLVRMPFMEGTMSDWIGTPEPPMGERLVSVAQLCNGLSWIYERGISGHGDLKPDNVLLKNIAKLLADQEGELNPAGPSWVVRVADLGWADIWQDLQGPEFARKALRPYLAPERLDGEVRGFASDMFAVGVITVELLTGSHPAGKPTGEVGRWKVQKYSNWAREGPRPGFEGVPSDIRALLYSCLAPRPEDRPSPREAIDRVCRAVSARLRYDLKAILDFWTEEARQLNDLTQDRWATEELACLGGLSLDKGIEELERAFDVSPFPKATGAAAWLTAGRSLTRLLLLRRSSRDLERAGEVALKMLRFVVVHFDGVDLRYALYRDPLTGKLTPSDLEAAEVMHEFGRHAESVLVKLGRSGETEASQLVQQLQNLWTKSQLTP